MLLSVLVDFPSYTCDTRHTDLHCGFFHWLAPLLCAIAVGWLGDTLWLNAGRVEGGWIRCAWRMIKSNSCVRLESVEVVQCDCVGGRAASCMLSWRTLMSTVRGRGLNDIIGMGPIIGI